MNKVKLLIASRDTDYTDHLSKVLFERYADDFSTTIVSSPDRLQALVSGKVFDVFLAEPEFLSGGTAPNSRLVLMLSSNFDVDVRINKRHIDKYQRISVMVSTILEFFSEVADVSGDKSSAFITAVWSPMGGCGKTTTALALAAQLASEGKQVLYLDLEPFSSSSLYFKEPGKGISHLLEKIDSNLDVLIRSVRQLDGGSGVYFIGRPDNFEDISILTEEYIIPLINSCAVGTDEVILDLGSGFDENVRAVLDRADNVLIVADASKTAAVKINQFCSQSNVFASIQEKVKLVCNRGAHSGLIGGVPEIRLPVVQSSDPIEVYKTLSAGYFS